MKPLAAGDLVQIIGKNCDDTVDEDNGVVFSIERIFVGTMRCTCGDVTETTFAKRPGADHGWYPQARLRRIEPLADLESEKRDEEVTA